MILTGLISDGTARIAEGRTNCSELIGYVLSLEHEDWESTLNIGDIAFYQSPKDGPFPDHQFRISARPSLGLAALSYTDNSDPDMVIADSMNPNPVTPGVRLIFNGTTGAVFPVTAAIPIGDARRALFEWLDTRTRPTCIQWTPHDQY
ncbi:Imm1 family immunity protein [Amycolatopsis sp. CA-126428]|uniref:Imm1 family immunity protein n=1 Tax=Amycolatopsis sp. CA-126428 TaxID=2073158 RepID=UPI000CD0EB6F